MSRTLKDKPFKVRFPEIYPYWMEVEKTKKKREVDTEWHWIQGTPSWWNNLFHTRPIRRKFQAWERNCEKTNISDLEDTFEPNNSNKPHKYYW